MMAGRMHLQIYPQLIRALGGNAAAACVLVLIQYRTNVHGYRRPDGTVWWKAPHSEIAEHTGLRPDQVRRLVAKLIEDGYMLAERHYTTPRDQTLSYRILYDDGEGELLEPMNTEMADSPDGAEPLWTTPDGESAISMLAHVANPPDGAPEVANPPSPSGESATSHVANPPSLPLRTQEEV